MHLLELVGNLDADILYLKRRKKHLLDTLITDMGVKRKVVEVDLAEPYPLEGCDTNNIPSWITSNKFEVFKSTVENFTGITLNQTEFARETKKDLTINMALNNLNLIGLSRKETNHYSTLLAHNNSLGNVILKVENLKTQTPISLIGWSVDLPAKGNGTYKFAKYSDLIVHGWLICEEEFDLYVRTGTDCVDVDFDRDRSDVVNLYRSRGYKIKNEKCGFTVKIPRTWKSFVLEFLTKDEIFKLTDFRQVN